MARMDAAFVERVEALRGTARAALDGRRTAVAVRAAAHTGDGDLGRLAGSVLRSPVRLAGLLDSADRQDPFLLAALAGKRALQDAAGVVPSRGRMAAPETVLERTARSALERHWERCRADPAAAKDQEKRWSARRSTLRDGPLGGALAAFESTYGAACSAEREAALGRPVSLVPPAGWKPQGSLRLTGYDDDRWVRFRAQRVVEAQAPADWPVRRGAPGRGAPGLPYGARVDRLARGRFRPVQAVSRIAFQYRLKRALRRGPEATRSFLHGVASSPRRSAAALRARLDPMLTAALVGQPAIDGLLRGKPQVDRSTPLGRLHEAAVRYDSAYLAEARASGADPAGRHADRVQHRALRGGLQGDPELRRLTGAVVNQVWRGGVGRPDVRFGVDTDLGDELVRGKIEGDVYDGWQARRAGVVEGRQGVDLDMQFSPDFRPDYAGVRGEPASARTDWADGEYTVDRMDADRRTFDAPPDRGPAADAVDGSDRPLQPHGDPIPVGDPQDPGRGADLADRSDPSDRLPVDPVAADEPEAPDRGIDSRERSGSAFRPAGDPVDPAGLPRATIVVPAEALERVQVPPELLDRLVEQPDGSFLVRDDPLIDAVVPREDGSYEVVFKPGLAADLVQFDDAARVASETHGLRTERQLVQVRDLKARDEFARISGESLADAVAHGRAPFEVPRHWSGRSACENPATGQSYDGLDGDRLRAAAIAHGDVADLRFASRDQIEAAGGRVAADAKGVVVHSEREVAAQPFAADGRVDLHADPVRYKVASPVVLYQVSTQVEGPVDLPRQSLRPPVQNLNVYDVAEAAGVPIARGSDADARSRFVPAEGAGSASRRVSEIKLYDFPGQSVPQRNAQVLRAIVDVLQDPDCVPAGPRLPPPREPGFLPEELVPGDPRLPSSREPGYDPDKFQNWVVRRELAGYMAVERAAARIGVAYEVRSTALSEMPEFRTAAVRLLSQPGEAARISREADRMSRWITDGATDRLHDRGELTEHERRSGAAPSAAGAARGHSRRPEEAYQSR